MSHLRAAAAHADRREGGRHGRPAARPAPALSETRIRPQLMRLAVLPPLAVALGSGAAVLFTVRSAGARTGPLLWAMVAGAAGLAVAGILIAAVAADRAARSVADRLDALRRTAVRGEADLHALVDALRQGETPPQRGRHHRPPADADDFELLAADLARAHDGAVTAVVRASQLSSRTGSEQKLEVFVNLARRLQSLVHREISILDDLENDIEDPDLLKGLFHVDHLATRIRRHAENLAVLGGAVSRRQWSNPVSMTEVLRSAIAEVEQYSRVRLVPPVDGELRGHAVADVIHLLAELVENATVFSAPHTQVLLRAGFVTSGCAVEVEDRGLGMPVTEQNRMNALLADPDQVNVASLLADGRIGLYVVSQLARRHGIQVRLQTNIYGGVQAVLVVPQALLGQSQDGPGTDTGEGAAAGQGTDTGEGAEAALVAPPLLPVSVPLPGGAGGGTAEPGTGNGGGEAGNGSAPVAGTETGAGDPGTSGTGTGTGAGWETGAADGSEDGNGGARAQEAGRRRHAQCESGRRDSEDGTRGGHEDGALPPLPVRGTRAARPTPADAVPGVSAGDRPVVEARTGILPVPRAGMVRDIMVEKPQLPRRRAQEHIAPQLRGGPAPRQAAGTVTGHDPGLMAAFQRGVGLAEAQQQLESGHEEPRQEPPGHGGPAYEEPRRERAAYEEPRRGGEAYEEPRRDGASYRAYGEPAYAHTAYGHMAPAHTDASPMDAAHTDSRHTDARHMAADHTGPPPMGAPDMAADHMGPRHTAPEPATPDHTAPRHTARHHMGSEHTTAGQPPAPAPIPQARAHAPAPDGTPGTGPAEGSAPAG